MPDNKKTIPTAWLRTVLLPPEPATLRQRGWQIIAVEYLLAIKGMPQGRGPHDKTDYYRYKAMLLAYYNNEAVDPTYAKLMVWT